jgi:hypothetical protein
MRIPRVAKSLNARVLNPIRSAWQLATVNWPAEAGVGHVTAGAMTTAPKTTSWVIGVRRMRRLLSGVIVTARRTRGARWRVLVSVLVPAVEPSSPWSRMR